MGWGAVQWGSSLPCPHEAAGSILTPPKTTKLASIQAEQNQGKRRKRCVSLDSQKTGLEVGFWLFVSLLFSFAFSRRGQSVSQAGLGLSRLSLNTGICRRELPSAKHPVSNSYLTFLNQLPTDVNLESSKVSCNDYTSVRRNISI